MFIGWVAYLFCKKFTYFGAYILTKQQNLGAMYNIFSKADYCNKK